MPQAYRQMRRENRWRKRVWLWRLDLVRRLPERASWPGAERRWIVLTTDGWHATLGRYTDPTEPEIA